MGNKQQTTVNVRALFVLAVCLYVGQVQADHFAGFGVVGVPANAGPVSWPVNSAYSWLSHRFPEATIRHSWRLHPGTDGGILIGNAQPSGAMTSQFLMFNAPTTIYSTGSGISLDSSETINLDNLTRKSATTVTNLGSSSGANPLVPLVPDITVLAPGENGWQLNPDNTYHIIYNTVGTCVGCEMILHFYGSTSPVSADGDINKDGNVNIADVLLAERYLLGLTTLTTGQIAHGDLAPIGQGDGILSTADVYLLIKQVTQ